MTAPISPLDKDQPFFFDCYIPGGLFQRLLPGPESSANALRCALSQAPPGALLWRISEYIHRVAYGTRTGLPVVSLRFNDSNDLACPFVTEAGCSVYPARPGSCRTYPLPGASPATGIPVD